jgi:hypothetical protein
MMASICLNEFTEAAESLGASSLSEAYTLSDSPRGRPVADEIGEDAVWGVRGEGQ